MSTHPFPWQPDKLHSLMKTVWNCCKLWKSGPWLDSLRFWRTRRSYFKIWCILLTKLWNLYTMYVFRDKLFPFGLIFFYFSWIYSYPSEKICIFVTLALVLLYLFSIKYLTSAKNYFQMFVIANIHMQWQYTQSLMSWVLLTSIISPHTEVHYHYSLSHWSLLPCHTQQIEYNSWHFPPLHISCNEKERLWSGCRLCKQTVHGSSLLANITPQCCWCKQSYFPNFPGSLLASV